jgi:hypothetical protein
MRRVRCSPAWNWPATSICVRETLRAVQLLLGHTRLRIEVDDAMAIAEQIDI